MRTAAAAMRSVEPTVVRASGQESGTRQSRNQRLVYPPFAKSVWPKSDNCTGENQYSVHWQQKSLRSGGREGGMETPIASGFWPQEREGKTRRGKNPNEMQSGLGRTVDPRPVGAEEEVNGRDVLDLGEAAGDGVGLVERNGLGRFLAVEESYPRWWHVSSCAKREAHREKRGRKKVRSCHVMSGPVKETGGWAMARLRVSYQAFS